jgi:ferredoxin
MGKFITVDADELKNTIKGLLSYASANAEPTAEKINEVIDRLATATKTGISKVAGKVASNKAPSEPVDKIKTVSCADTDNTCIHCEDCPLDCPNKDKQEPAAKDDSGSDDGFDDIEREFWDTFGEANVDKPDIYDDICEHFNRRQVEISKTTGIPREKLPGVNRKDVLYNMETDPEFKSAIEFIQKKLIPIPATADDSISLDIKPEKNPCRDACERDMPDSRFSYDDLSTTGDIGLNQNTYNFSDPVYFNDCPDVAVIIQGTYNRILTYISSGLPKHVVHPITEEDVRTVYNHPISRHYIPAMLARLSECEKSIIDHTVNTLRV